MSSINPQPARSSPDAGGPLRLDERGLPPGHPFDPACEVTPRQVQAMRDAGEPFMLIDCRLPGEYQITHIAGSDLIPLQQMAQYLVKLRERKDDKLVVYCRSGVRSLQFAQILKRQGFGDVKSMAGGILLWNQDIHPGGPLY